MDLGGDQLEVQISLRLGILFPREFSAYAHRTSNVIKSYMLMRERVE